MAFIVGKNWKSRQRHNFQSSKPNLECSLAGFHAIVLDIRRMFSPKKPTAESFILESQWSVHNAIPQVIKVGFGSWWLDSDIWLKETRRGRRGEEVSEYVLQLE